MKVLIIVNNVFYEKKGSLYTFRAIGDFGMRLLELGNEVEMIQTKLKKEEEFHDFDLGRTGIRTTALKRYKSKLFTYLITYIVSIWRIWKNDFVYIYYPTNYHYLAFVSLMLGKKYGLNVRGQERVDSFLSRLLYRNAKFVFTVSPGFTAIVNSAGGLGITQRPGISFGYDDILNRRTLTVPDGFHILYLGRLDLEKGLMELIEAVGELVRRGFTKVRFTIVGDGYHDLMIKQRAKDLTLDNWIHFYGPETNVDKIKDIYKSADLFVMPTYHEGFPRTLYEAMIFGIPIITTFVGGIPFIMQDNVNCIKIESKSVDSIVEKVIYALENYSALNVLVDNAESLIRIILDPDKKSHADVFHDNINN
jgi:glycosyltransferase involved in cell wall biosynthesis